MIDFERTYRIRRAICRALQQSQKAESQIAERSGQLAIKGKRELLLLLSAWLLDLNSSTGMSEPERTAVQSLTRMSLENWIKLQAEAVQIAKDVKEAEGKEKEAKFALHKMAPLGAFTQLSAGAESRSEIKILQNNAAVAHKHRENLCLALKQNIAKRQSLGETFSRDCLSQLEKLESAPVLGKEVQAIRSQMNNEINRIWEEHRKQQSGELEQIAQFVEHLREGYKDTSESPPQQRQSHSPQKQIDAEPRQRKML